MKYIVVMSLIALSFSGLQASLGGASTSTLPAAPAQDLDFGSTNTYKGKQITAENILELAPQAPADVKAQVDEFLTKNLILSNILSGESYYQKIMFYPKAPFSIAFSQPGDVDKELQQLYFGSMSQKLKTIWGINKPNIGSNFVIPMGDWFVKVSGFSNRRENIINELGLPYGSNITQANLEKFKAGMGKTYQTISRMAYWLRAKEAKEKLKLNRICLPQEYLVHIPGRPTQVDDTNYVIIEEKIKNAKPITQTDLATDPEVIEQLVQLIGYAALWDINPNNILANEDMTCTVDLEQPNVYNPSNFFDKNTGLHRAFMEQGWKELEDNIIKPAAAAQKKDVKDLLEEKKLMQESIKQSWK